MLKEIKSLAEQQSKRGATEDPRVAQHMSKFGEANAKALTALQEELVAKRMEALATRLGLAPEEVHLEVRRTAGGRCFGLLKFIVDIGFGVREVTATDIPRSGGNLSNGQEVDRGYFGSSANTAAEVLASIDAFKPSSIVAWTNGRLAFLDVLLEGASASVRVCTKPSPAVKDSQNKGKEVDQSK